MVGIIPQGDALGYVQTMPFQGATRTSCGISFILNMIKKYTSQELFSALQNEREANSTFCHIYMGNPDAIVKPFLHNIVESVIKEWLEGWLKANDIAFSPNPNTQMPPDLFLDPDNKEENLMEVKAFNYNASPGFDIADFRAYQEEIIDKPYMLHVKYLIFGYEMTEDGYVIIRDLWLKNVWEICRAMSNYPLNLQVKDNVIHKIRPAKWFGNNSNYPTFSCLEDFVSAIEETVYKNPKTHDIAGTWCKRFKDAYEQKYDKKLSIPRWGDIESQYVK